jgi:tetratricopeptide (TPR) repeat protein
MASLPSAQAEMQTSKAQIYYNQGIEKWNQDNLVGAKESFMQSIEVQPTSDALFNLGNVLHSLGHSSEAMKNWSKSLELKPTADAHLNIANVLALVVKEPKKAYEHYEKALELSPEDGEINYNYGVVLDAFGELEKAVAQYSIAVSWGIEHAEKNLRNARARWLAKQLENDAKSK